jgi:predicted nuclease with TOPRIM domain
MADTGACMTPDQCFDEMAVALGVAEPKDTGYTELLDLVKKLKEENEKLKHKEYCLRQDAKGYSPSEVQEYREETEELKEENKKLKEENKNLKGGIRALADEMKKMKEENEKLQKVDESDEESDEEDSDEPPDCCECVVKSLIYNTL